MHCVNAVHNSKQTLTYATLSNSHAVREFDAKCPF